MRKWKKSGRRQIAGVSSFGLVLLFAFNNCTNSGFSSLAGNLSSSIQSLPAQAVPTIVVNDANYGPSTATHVTDYSDINWSNVKPGTQIFVAAGTYSGTMNIMSAQGTLDAPIVVQAIDSSNKPVISGGGLINIQNSSYVHISDIVVSGSAYQGVNIQAGSHHIWISNCEIASPSDTGIIINTGAGTGNHIFQNVVHDSATNGMGVYYVNSEAGDPSIFSNNLVYNSGVHGFEITGSRYIITGNEVHDSGLSTGGTSGIHLYAPDATPDTCNENQVTNNISHDNHDTSTNDGNGFQIDHWCDSNIMSFNLSYNNDGAGINVYDGQNNQVTNNTLYADSKDQRPGFRGEIILSTQSAQVNRATGNKIFNNVLVTTQVRSGTDAGVTPQVAPLVVDYLTASQPNTLGPNLYYNQTGGGVVYLGGPVLTTQSDVEKNSILFHGNIVANPNFVNTAAPLSSGLKLSKYPGAQGVVLTSVNDFAGLAAAANFSFFGAYFTSP